MEYMRGTNTPVVLVVEDEPLLRLFASGIMLAIRIRNKWPTIQIIITSGRPWPEEAVVPPDIPFFSKPYRQDRVLDAVRKMAA